MSKFSSYSVGYNGDHAAVTLQLTKPEISTSSKPKDKDHRETFEVVTVSKSFNQQGIVVAAKEALAGKDYSTYINLLNAQSSLQHFINQNGNTNPYEAADWETTDQPALRMA